ncbi:hypothetical protein KPP10_gp120 [Pseudomonas phage KPP10]|uniref:Uncharacterized protein n=1 Tax=Pseudomonas phage KPP10 TaxID=582345 RepID=D6RRR7_BPKPP|nr:hypothetical protein KPP10_gp120 [Pseudomonas phage KPP10]BAJ09085.1 hypothetical protein [Pseudomonas phage KPP10]
MMENRNGTTETACPKCGGSGHADSGGVQSWGEPISIPCDCLTEQEEFLAWANEEYEVEEGYELNESNPAVMENKKGWMARAALPKRSKFRQHLDECADEVDTWPSYKREALKNPSPKCSTCHDQGEVFIGPGKVESHMLEEPEPIYAPCPDCEQPSPLQSEQAEAERPEVIRVPSCENSYGFGYVDGSCHVDLRKYRNHLEDILDSLPNDEPLMTVSQHERIVEALRFERQQMDRAFTTCINERDAALAEVERLIGVCASLDSEMRDMENKRDAIIAMRDAALARVAELEKPDPDYTQHPQIVGYARKKELEPLLDPCQPDGSHIYIGLDHPSLWAEEPPYEFLTPLYTAPVAKAQHSVPDGWRDMLAELQWHYEPYDDHYHRDQGFYCPVCGGEKDEGHKQGCSLAKLLATVPSDDQHSVPEEFSFEYRHLNGECHTVTVSREQVINEMPDFLFEALCSKFCNCEPVGETNVVECCCDEYAEEFKLIAATPGKEVV